MSLDPILWALKDAPVADVEGRAVLTIMAEAADEDGCNSYLSQATIARRSLLSDRTVRRRLDELEERGLLARGDQSVVAHIPPDRRPINYDLLIPFSWYSRIERVNEFRAGRNRPPLTAETRPDITVAPPRKTRKDFGTIRPPKDQDAGPEPETSSEGEGVDRAAGLQVRPEESDIPAGLQVRPDSESVATGLQVQSDRTCSPTTLPFTHASNPEELPPRSNTDTYVAREEGFKPGEDSQNGTELGRYVSWFVGARPDWKPDAVASALTGAVLSGVGDLREVSFALRELAEGKFGVTEHPGRLNALADAPWWGAMRARRIVEAEVKRRQGPRCQVPGHFLQPAVGCTKCRAWRHSESFGGYPDESGPIKGAGIELLKRVGRWSEDAVVSPGSQGVACVRSVSC